MTRRSTALAAALLSACISENPPVGDDPRRTAPPGSTGPALAITAPDDGATVTPDYNDTFAVAFVTNGIVLRAPGACGTDPGCAHVEVRLDDARCDLPGHTYNAATGISPVFADVTPCPAGMRSSTHSVTLSLHRDDGTPVVANGATVQDHVTLSVTEVPPEPTVAITSPLASSTVRLAPDGTLPVTFDVTNFVLRPPGTCAGAVGCGHVHLLVDDAPACNAPGTEWNAEGAAPALAFAMNLCPPAMRTGPATLTVQLHDDAHRPLRGAAGPFRATVAVDIAP